MRTSTWVRLGGLGVLWLAAAAAAQAQDWGLVLNGKAIHMHASKHWNEDNWGLGVEREFDGQSRWVKMAVANGFLDSADEMSYMAGGGLKRRFRPGSAGDLYVDLGVVGFLMTRQDVNDNRPFPGLLPAMTIGTPKIALNVTYLPGVFMEETTAVSHDDPTVTGVFFLQLRLSPALLGFPLHRAKN